MAGITLFQLVRELIPLIRATTGESFGQQIDRQIETALIAGAELAEISIEFASDDWAALRAEFGPAEAVAQAVPSKSRRL